jgi:cytochrome bd-type quinol oxidase subunit 2
MSDGAITITRALVHDASFKVMLVGVLNFLAMALLCSFFFSCKDFSIGF